MLNVIRKLPVTAYSVQLTKWAGGPNAYKANSLGETKRSALRSTHCYISLTMKVVVVVVIIIIINNMNNNTKSFFVSTTTYMK
jgi:hypothetical protein